MLLSDFLYRQYARQEMKNRRGQAMLLK